MTNAEKERLTVSIYRKLYPLALRMRLSEAQVDDIASRIAAAVRCF